MFSWFKIEIASLVFACLSVLATVSCFFVFGVRAVRVTIAVAIYMAEDAVKYPGDIKDTILKYGYLYFNLNLSIILSIIMVSIAFSVILTKGLLSKNAHLVKAYFIYGVTMNTVMALFGLNPTIQVKTKLGYFLFGCFLYCLVLMMIRKTYLKLAKEKEDCDKKKLESENTIIIKL